MTMASTIKSTCLQLPTALMAALINDSELERHTSDLMGLEEELAEKRSNGLLDSRTASIAWCTASNISVLGKAALELQRTQELNIASLCRDLENIVLEHDSTPLLVPIPGPGYPTSPSSPRYPENSQSTEPAALRQWFASNLYFPYPTPAEKQALASETGLSIKKISSNLCNLRRRSGWQALVTKYCNGDREEAHKLFRRVASGKEKRKEVLDEVEALMAYSTRTLVVRDCVAEVTRQSALTKSSTYQSLSATTHTTDEADAVECITSPAPKRTFSSSSTESDASNSSSATNTSTLIPATSAFTYIPSTPAFSSSSSLTKTSSSSSKRPLNPEAGEFVPAAKRVRIRFNITEPESEPELNYGPLSIVPAPPNEWANLALSQPLWMNNEPRELSPFPDTPPQATWDVPSLPAPEPDATFMSIFGLDEAVDFDMPAQLFHNTIKSDNMQ